MRPVPGSPPSGVGAGAPAAVNLDAKGLVVGARVRHATFGEGQVTRVIGSGLRATLAISFPGLGQKILDPRFATLELLATPVED